MVFVKFSIWNKILRLSWLVDGQDPSYIDLKMVSILKYSLYDVLYVIRELLN